MLQVVETLHATSLRVGSCTQRYGERFARKDAETQRGGELEEPLRKLATALLLRVLTSCVRPASNYMQKSTLLFQ